MPARPAPVLVVGSAFASAAAVMIFVGLIGIYLAERANAVSAGDTWLPSEISIPLQQPNTILFTLLMSVVTMAWAVQAVANNDKVNSYLALGVTAVFGFATIVMTTYLWSLMGADVAANTQSLACSDQKLFLAGVCEGEYYADIGVQHVFALRRQNTGFWFVSQQTR